MRRKSLRKKKRVTAAQRGSGRNEDERQVGVSFEIVVFGFPLPSVALTSFVLWKANRRQSLTFMSLRLFLPRFFIVSLEVGLCEEE